MFKYEPTPQEHLEQAAHTRLMLAGKAKEVFDEIRRLARLEPYQIGQKYQIEHVEGN